MNFYTLIYKVVRKAAYILQSMWMWLEKKQLGRCGRNVTILYPNRLSPRMFIGDNVNIYEHGTFIIGPGGRFVMKDNSGCAQRLTVITGKHGHRAGTLHKELMVSRELDEETTVTVEEDVRIGANVTLLPGVTVGRGSVIGACSVVTRDIPPYSIAAGNPARVIGSVFTPEEIRKHEAALYGNTSDT